MPLREGVARGFLRFSPRNLRLSAESAKRLSAELCDKPYSRILAQDSKKRVLWNALAEVGWKVGRAIEPRLRRKCSMVTTYDLPLDERLVDVAGQKPDVSNSSYMHGISMEIDDRKAWAFYTDDGETARIVSEGDRKQGMLVATRNEDLFEVASCLVQFLATAKKSSAVFSVDMGRFVREYDPITMIRMVLESPKPFQHSAVPLSKDNKKAALQLFSEYYDESLMQSRFRLRRFRAEGNYSIHLIEGGFVITRFEGDTGLIYDIYVTPKRQGEGLGGELMRCALTSLSGRVSSVYLHTSYPRARRLYEKFGFKAVYSQLGIRLDEVALHPPHVK